MEKPRIAAIHAWEAFDSRGSPAVACAVILVGGFEGAAVAPSGASRGHCEVAELRDGGVRFMGRGVRRAVEGISAVIAPALVGSEAVEIADVDRRLRELDGTEDLHVLGGNAVLAVSIAFALARANATRAPLFRTLLDATPAVLPLPMVNVLSGGLHARGGIDIQDLLVVPVGAADLATAIEWAWRVRFAADEVASESGLIAHLVADEGGIGPILPSVEAAMTLLMRAIERAGLRPGEDAAIAIDVAANQLWQGETYRLPRAGLSLSSDEFMARIAGWCVQFPIVSIEDPAAEDDGPGWASITASLAGRIQVIGDDLFCTNPASIFEGARRAFANAVLIKPNQIGTLSGALQATQAASDCDYAPVTSGRSGDTEDSWLADLAVGTGSGQVKIGSFVRSERTAKWNRLLRIASEYDLPYAGRTALAPRSGSPRPLLSRGA